MVKPGYKQTEIGVIPEDWDCVRLGEKAKIYRGGSPRPIQDYITTSSDGANWIKIGDVRENDKYIRSTQEKITPEGISKSREVHIGDFILSNSMSFGRPYILDIDGCIHDGWLTIQDYKNTFSTEYLYYLLSSDLVYQQYIGMAAGSSVKNLNKDKVSALYVIYSAFSEQERIAEALSDVDELISSLEKLIEKYKSIKATCLQQMFPQKGETTPKMRLPGFTGAWEQCKFSEVYSFASEGGTPDTNTAAYYRNGTIPFVRIEDTENKYIDSVKTFITEEGLKHSSAWLIPSGSVIFTNGATVGNVAINHIPVATKQGILGIIPNKTVTAEYLYYLLSSGFFQREVRNRQATGTFATIILKNLNEINVFVPDKAEQQKISGYLSSIDNLITLHQLKLDKAKKIKQGMMQQLLTGKIRLV